jgi:hypothetical protein
MAIPTEPRFNPEAELLLFPRPTQSIPIETEAEKSVVEAGNRKRHFSCDGKVSFSDWYKNSGGSGLVRDPKRRCCAEVRGGSD